MSGFQAFESFDSDGDVWNGINRAISQFYSQEFQAKENAEDRALKLEMHTMSLETQKFMQKQEHTFLSRDDIWKHFLRVGQLSRDLGERVGGNPEAVLKVQREVLDPQMKMLGDRITEMDQDFGRTLTKGDELPKLSGDGAVSLKTYLGSTIDRMNDQFEDDEQGDPTSEDFAVALLGEPLSETEPQDHSGKRVVVSDGEPASDGSIETSSDNAGKPASGDPAEAILGKPLSETDPQDHSSKKVMVKTDQKPFAAKLPKKTAKLYDDAMAVSEARNAATAHSAAEIMYAYTPKHIKDQLNESGFGARSAIRAVVSQNFKLGKLKAAKDDMQKIAEMHKEATGFLHGILKWDLELMKEKGLNFRSMLTKLHEMDMAERAENASRGRGGRGPTPKESLLGEVSKLYADAALKSALSAQEFEQDKLLGIQKGLHQLESDMAISDRNTDTLLGIKQAMIDTSTPEGRAKYNALQEQRDKLAKERGERSIEASKRISKHLGLKVPGDISEEEKKLIEEKREWAMEKVREATTIEETAAALEFLQKLNQRGGVSPIKDAMDFAAPLLNNLPDAIANIVVQEKSDGSPPTEEELRRIKNHFRRAASGKLLGEETLGSSGPLGSGNAPQDGQPIGLPNITRLDPKEVTDRGIRLQSTTQGWNTIRKSEQYKELLRQNPTMVNYWNDAINRGGGPKGFDSAARDLMGRTGVDALTVKEYNRNLKQLREQVARIEMSRENR